MALLKSDKTTIILVNEVKTTSNEGAIAITVIRAISCKILPVSGPVSEPRSSENC